MPNAVRRRVTESCGRVKQVWPMVFLSSYEPFKMSQSQPPNSEQLVFDQLPDALLTGDTLVAMSGPPWDREMSFIELPSKADPSENKWKVKLSFDGWTVAMHPPANVMAVSEYTGSSSYVTSEQFLNPVYVTLTNFTHA